ncbi:hypothetical protein ACLOJK_027087 [Asimina triloba]
MAAGNGSSGELPVARSDPGKSMVTTVRPNPSRSGDRSAMRSFIFPIFVRQPWLPNPSPWPFSSTIHSTARPATTHNAHSNTAGHINGHDSSHPSRSSASPDPDTDPHPTITIDGCPFFHDAKSRWVETHLAVRQQALHPSASRLREAPASRPRGDGIHPHQPASAHSSLARRQICLHQPFHHGQHNPPTTSADGLKPILTPATI